MDERVKDIIIDVEQLGEWSSEIDHRKESKLVQEIVLAIKSTMREKNLVYLTAPQIGYQRRIFCVKFDENDYRSFINPMVENLTNFTLARESCLSLPDKSFIRPRFDKMTIFYLTPMGKVESRQLIGKAAHLVQHCVDHLDGLLLCDVGLEVDELYDNASEDERAEVLQAYMESLDIRSKKLNEEIENDAELKELNDAAKFIASVKTGETKLAGVSEQSE